MTCKMFDRLSKKPVLRMTRAELAAVAYHLTWCLECDRKQAEIELPPTEVWEAMWDGIRGDPECQYGPGIPA